MKDLLQIRSITRMRTNLRTNKTTTEKVLVITNLPFGKADAAQLLAMSRFYWQIENGLYSHIDMVFGEGRSTIRAKNGPANIATLRNFATGILVNNGIANIKHCVDNRRHNPRQLLQRAA